MKEYITSYGVLKGIVEEEYYANGVLKECILEEESPINTTCGLLVPKYDYSDVRSKYRNVLSFYIGGQIKSIYLQERSKIVVPQGTYYAEMITFYEDGSLHRIFPIYGKISGYWSEEEENKALEIFSGTVGGIPINNKVACYCFYPTGEFKSLTFAQNENLVINTPQGEMEIRIGISFYEKGELESIEPAKEIPLKTIVGCIMAYDNNPIGVHADNNSLKFNEAGEILSVKTIMTGFEIIDMLGEKTTILPKRRKSFIDIEKFEMVPVMVTFYQDSIEIQDSDGWVCEYNLKKYQIKSIFNTLYRQEESCTDCSSCSGCQ
jgi:hypothetical protein